MFNGKAIPLPDVNGLDELVQFSAVVNDTNSSLRFSGPRRLLRYSILASNYR